MVYAKEGDPADTLCPAKTMLFTDPLCGICDALVEEGVAPAYYKKLAKTLKNGEKDEQWGYLFKSMRTLCEALAVRFDLGVKTRNAYRNGERGELEIIVKKDYPAAIRKIQLF